MSEVAGRTSEGELSNSPFNRLGEEGSEGSNAWPKVTLHACGRAGAGPHLVCPSDHTGSQPLALTLPGTWHIVTQTKGK